MFFVPVIRDKEGHPEFISGSGSSSVGHLPLEILKQVQYDVTNRHPEFISGSHLVWYLLVEVLKRVQYDVKDIQHDVKLGIFRKLTWKSQILIGYMYYWLMIALRY